MLHGLESDKENTAGALCCQIKDLKKKLEEEEWCLEAVTKSHEVNRYMYYRQIHCIVICFLLVTLAVWFFEL